MSCKYSRVFALFLLNLHFMQARNESGAPFLYGDPLRNLPRMKRQAEDLCLFPDHPPHGWFKILGFALQSYSPNSYAIPNTIIDLSCGDGYETESGGLARAICYMGAWTPAISKMGGCVRTCPLVETERETMIIKCVHDNPKVTCARPIEGTRIEMECKPFYENKFARPVITCRDGSWDNDVPLCQFKCGQKRVNSGTSLTSRGRMINKSEYPWVVAIYREGNNKEPIGGGSIVSPRLVLTAAHIFTNTSDFRITNDYVVASGKYYRDLNDERDVHVQTSGIKHLYTSDSYKGGAGNYLADIVIITLETPFVLNEYVQPVCIDWENKQGAADFRQGNEGIVVGWGFLEEYGKEQQAIPISYESKITCRKHLPSVFMKYFTYDKICAQHFDNRTSTCSTNVEVEVSLSSVAYSGNGLFFRSSEDSRFYLRGILNIGSFQFADCGSTYFGIFTEVKDLSDLLGE